MPDSSNLSKAGLSSANLGKLLIQTAQRFPDEPVLIFPDSNLSYQDLVTRSYKRALGLKRLGIQAGDHIGLLMPNCPEYIELLFGIIFLGACAVPINARNKAAELGYVIANADLKVLITNDLASEYVDFAELLHETYPTLAASENPAHLSLPDAPLLRAIVLMGKTASPGMLQGEQLSADDNTASATELSDIESELSTHSSAAPCIMMYTSGTTAHPKGCPISHAALVANGRAMNRQRFFMNHKDRFWSPLPMFHMSSILPLAACLDAGAALLSMNHFDAGIALDMMEQEQVSIAFPSFPTLTNELINHPSFSKRNLTSLKRINNVAPLELLRTFQSAFPQAVQTGAYGLTEACGVISFNHPDEDFETRLSTCGQPFEGIEVKIVDPDTDQILPPGERGEMCISGYSVFSGYYKSPEKNAEALKDGWLYTGDLCSVDKDNRISFHGRLKDMLKVGGENVAAIEIESFLAAHPCVKLAQVIGVPDEHLLEVAAAYIELKPGASLSETELITWCKGKIASFKVPRYVRFVTEWPMSSTKVQKFRLIEQFQSAENQAVSQ